MSKENKAYQIKLIKHCLSKKPTKYDSKTHITLLIETFCKGKSIKEFCAKAFISEKTFHNWKKQHKEFKDAYDVAINVAASYWEDLPFENPEFNYPYYLAVMRHRFGFGKAITKIKNEESPIQMVKAVQEGLDNQEITAQEANQIIDIALKKHQLLTNSDLTNVDGKKHTLEECMEIAKTLLPAAEILEKKLGGKSNE